MTDLNVCNVCKKVIVNSFTYCCHCGKDLKATVAEGIEGTTKMQTSFSNIDFDIITHFIAFLHASFKPLSLFTNENDDELHDLNNILILNKHYKSYKTKYYVYQFNEEHSWKYYNNDDCFCLKIQVENINRQISINLNGFDLDEIPKHVCQSYALNFSCSSGKIQFNDCNVKILNLSACDISDCSPLSRVHDLNLSNCDQITDISALKNVKICNLSGCTMISDISALKDVYCLNLSGCTGISDISPLNRVHDLNLSRCSQLTDVSSLSTVNRLNLSNCTNIVDVSALLNVESLDLSGCHKIKYVSDLDNVHHLRLNYCNGITYVASVPNVFILELRGCKNLTIVSGLAKLERLVVDNCTSLVELCNMPEVTEIFAFGCLKLDILCNVPKLKRLDIRNCKKIKNLTTIPLETLDHLSVKGCDNLKSIQFNTTCIEL